MPAPHNSDSVNSPTPQTNCETQEELLSCQETLDRSSPTLWPQPVPGLLDFIKKSEPEWKLGECEWDLSELDRLETEDYESIYYFRESKPLQLLEQIQEINDYAYQLDLEESREVNRGIILNIFDNHHQPETDNN
ncbi:protein lin-52 homolog [Panonychus citri]|uniref:protein lin-52 homolog n=1 Tax=Panonychus citri TaxID=50023 RepID=UPI002307A67B|nr:protein lin-52 homolog [Panonychus citri]